MNMKKYEWTIEYARTGQGIAKTILTTIAGLEEKGFEIFQALIVAPEIVGIIGRRPRRPS